MKRILCALLLLFLLVGCAATNTQTQPADKETVSTGEAELESAEPEVQEKEIANFEKLIKLLETKTLSGYDDNANTYEFKDNVMRIYLDNPIILQTTRPPFVVDTVTLKDGEALGSCEHQFKENHLLEEMCRQHIGETIELNYDDYYITTPIKWLKEYHTVEIASTKTDVVVAGRISATKLTFVDGTMIWLNYKGIPVRVEQDDLVLGFHDVKIA